MTKYQYIIVRSLCRAFLDYPGMTHCQQADPLSKYPCTPKLPWTSPDYPGMTNCQQTDPSDKVSLYAKVTLDVPGLSRDDPLPAGRPLSKYPCTPKLPWTSPDYPGMTHCQQAEPSVKVSLYAKVTLDVPGLSRDDPLPAGRPLCHSIPVCKSYLGYPWIIQG